MLYDCTECDKSISETASLCPHCGLKDAGPRARSYWLGPSSAAQRAERERESKSGDRCVYFVLLCILLGGLLPLFKGCQGE